MLQVIDVEIRLLDTGPRRNYLLYHINFRIYVCACKIIVSFQRSAIYVENIMLLLYQL